MAISFPEAAFLLVSTKDARTGIVYKKDDKHAKENYRPIAVLSFVNKVFGRLLCNQITTK